jgi:hypothetical protein
MEEGEDEGLERIIIIEDKDANKRKNIPNAPPLAGPISSQNEEKVTP